MILTTPTLTTPTESLGIANVDYYWYLNQSGTYTVDGTDDKKEFDDTLVREGGREGREGGREDEVNYCESAV